jgi:hypothetical protein
LLWCAGHLSLAPSWAPPGVFLRHDKGSLYNSHIEDSGDALDATFRLVPGLSSAINGCERGLSRTVSPREASVCTVHTMQTLARHKVFACDPAIRFIIRVCTHLSRAQMSALCHTHLRTCDPADHISSHSTCTRCNSGYATAQQIPLPRRFPWRWSAALAALWASNQSQDGLTGQTGCR